MADIKHGDLFLGSEDQLEIEGQHDAVFGTAIADSPEFNIKAGETVALVHYGDENEVNHPFAQKADHVFCCYGLRSTSPKVRSLWLGKTVGVYTRSTKATLVEIYESS